MAVMVGSARIDENGNAYNGKAGDQTGKEVSTQNWYLHSKGWRVFRAKNAKHAQLIAACMKAACANNHIGYDQYQRNSLYTEASKYNFDVSKVTKDTETDCSALVRVCCAYAGIMGLPSDFRTGNMPSNLMNTGAFVELKGDKYTKQSSYLGYGDILVTASKGHTVVVLSNGSHYEGSNVVVKDYALGDRYLKEGCAGADVKELQLDLIALGYSCGSWGADGDFGDATELAVKKFQKDNKLEVDGIVGPKTVAKLEALIIPIQKPKTIQIIGGNCYIRAEANTNCDKIAVAHEGDKYEYANETVDGWNKIKYKETTAWVSGKYSKLI